MSALDRGGHLSELALDRYRFDPTEAAPELRQEVEAHLANCAECRQVVTALETEDARFALTPPVTVTTAGATMATAAATATAAPGQVISLAERRAARTRMGWTAGITVLLAAAAAVFLLTRPTALDDPEKAEHITLRGSAIDFEIIVDDGHASRLVADGATVHPREKMAFRVKARLDGYLAIVGRDDTGASYACYPQGAELAAVQAVAVTHAVEPKDLPVALRFDDLVGTERISAVFCSTPFTGAEAAMLAGENAVVRDGCHVRTLSLLKRPTGSGANGAPR